MSLEQDLKTLAQHESFARFLQVIADLREEAISELHQSDTKQLQQISGRILTYDQILQMCDWRNLQKVHGERLRFDT